MRGDDFAREVFDYWHTRLLIRPVATEDGRHASAVRCRSIEGRPVFHAASDAAEFHWWSAPADCPA